MYLYKDFTVMRLSNQNFNEKSFKIKLASRRVLKTCVISNEILTKEDL